MLENRWYKVGQTGGTFVVAQMFNPITKENKTVVARDYDYADCSRDNEEIYCMPIEEEAVKAWKRYKGVISVGDTVEVYKGRKIPKGTIAKVADIYDWKDRYGRVQTTYAVFEDGRKTNILNCRFA